MNSTFNYIAGGTLLRRQVVHFYSGLDRNHRWSKTHIDEPCLYDEPDDQRI